MSGYDTNDIGSNANQGGPHDIGNQRPYPLNHEPFGAIRHRLVSDRALTMSGAANPSVDFLDPPFQIPSFGFQDMPGGDQFPDYHTTNGGYNVNPQIPAHYHVDGTLINHDQVPQWPIDSNQHQAQDPSYNFGQQQAQIQGNYTSTLEHCTSQQAFIDLPSQVPPINFDQPFSMPVYVPYNNGHNMSQQIPTQFQRGEASAYCGQQPQIPVNQINFNGVNNNQQIPAQFQLGETPTYCGQQPQIPINQTNFNGVNNHEQAYQGMATAAVSSFASLSAQEQDAEFRHFVQQRLALGETKMMEPGTFKSWYIGQQVAGNTTPTLVHGVTPLHPSLVFKNNVPIQRPMIPLNNQEYMQPPPMIYQNTGEKLTTGFQHMMGPLTTLSGQAMQPNSEQYLQQPRKSINSEMRTRRTSLAVAPAGQSILPGPSRSMPRPVLQIITTMPASPSTTEIPAPPSIIRAPAPPSITTMPASSSTTRAQASPSTTAPPAVTRRNRKTKNVNPEQMEKKTCATGKMISQEQETEATRSNQRRFIPIAQILGAADGKYTVSFSDLESNVFDSPSDTELYDCMATAIADLDAKNAEPDTKLFMLRNEESLIIVRMALGEMLRKLIALSLDTSTDARKSLKDFAAIKNIPYSSIESLEFAPKSQFLKEVKVASGTEQTAQPAKDDVPPCATHTLMHATINSDLDGTEAKGSWSLYTKTAFIDESTPLKYAIGLKMEVAEIGDRLARDNQLIYERSLPSNITGEPLWADILDLFKIQAAEWAVTTSTQDPLTFQTSTSASPSNQQQIDTEEQWPVSGPVQGQRAQTGQSITPEPLTVRGKKRKRQEKPKIHATPVIRASSSETSNSSSDKGNSPTSNTSTDRTSVSPQPVAGAPQLSDDSRRIKRSKNEHEMGSLEGGTGMKESLPSSIQPPTDQISANDHMHPARSPSEIVRSPITTETQNRMPAQVSGQADESFPGAQVASFRQGMLLANNGTPYQYTISELTQPSRTFSAQSNMPKQVQARLLRQPTAEELAPYIPYVASRWKRSFPAENKSS
ncbi:uncharacterized protein EAE97_005288 [Botrytis byssoidea]|uniref:Uncharacterized protein n=1 Tax=Botrytis byssoidea TaxID=139641 RepID=A0A9P5M361_9HELO|nr:uncharacterized protein EAE97_005288 [Botrytis byssoidea]KAF7944655.1 hypothetical protein EAE97_005288 [Botrytis byssoidea]